MSRAIVARVSQNKWVRKFWRSAVWWSGFKLGNFTGAILGMLFMAFLLTTAGAAEAILRKAGVF